MKRFALALVVFVAAVSCAPYEEPGTTQSFSAEDEAAIRGLISSWEAAWDAGDLAGVFALVTDDYFEARSTAVEGREAVIALYEGFTLTYTSVETTVRRIEGDGRIAFAWVSFENELTTQEGVDRLQSGNTLWALRKDADGEWRFAAAGFGATTRDEPAG